MSTSSRATRAVSLSVAHRWEFSVFRSMAEIVGAGASTAYQTPPQKTQSRANSGLRNLKFGDVWNAS